MTTNRKVVQYEEKYQAKLALIMRWQYVEATGMTFADFYSTIRDKEDVSLTAIKGLIENEGRLPSLMTMHIINRVFPTMFNLKMNISTGRVTPNMATIPLSTLITPAISSEKKKVNETSEVER